MPPEPESILVYTGLELMGDGFMKLPFLRAVRAAWPKARVTWLAGKGKTVYAGELKPLVTAYLDEIIEDAGIGTHMGELLSRPLPGRRFELVIDTQRRLLTTLILRRVRHGVFVSGAAGFLLSDRRPVGRYKKPPSMVAQLLDLVAVASGGAPRLARPPELPNEYDAAARGALPGTADYVGIVPGAGGAHKCWPRERYVALARWVSEAGGRVAFILGPDERRWLAELREAIPTAFFPLQDPNVPRDVAASPLFTMAAGRRLRLAVTNDCGTAHMLAAVETPLISLFGPSAAAKFSPATPDLVVIRAQDFGSDAMAAIPVEAALATVKAKLANKGR